MRLVYTLLLIAQLSMGGTVVPRSVSPVDQPRDDVVFFPSVDGLRMIDPATGAVRWEYHRFGERIGVAHGRSGVVFVSVTDTGGGGTDVFALPVTSSSPTPDLIGRVGGDAAVKGVSPDGDSLFVGQFDATDGSLRSILTLPIPPPWQGVSPYRTMSTGSTSVVSTDGRDWYNLHPMVTQSIAQLNLLMGRYDGVRGPTTSDIPLSTTTTYFSLLLSPDGRSLYAVDHGTDETVREFDTGTRREVRSASLRTSGTKRSACAATISPDGTRLYALAYDGNREDGIDVIDVATLRRVGHLLAGERLVCLAMAPSGERLYVSRSGGGLSPSSIATIDVSSGAKIAEVPLATGGDVVHPALVA